MFDVLLFGDSILAGYRNGFVAPVITNAVQNAFPNWQVGNASVPGDTTEMALERATFDVGVQQPRRLVLFFGANDLDVFSGITPDTYQNNLVALAQMSGANDILLVGPPLIDEKRVPDRPIKAQKRYNRAAQLAATACQATYLDLWSLMAAQPTDLHVADGLHLNNTGNDLLCRALIASLKLFA